jgi:glutaredoxin
VDQPLNKVFAKEKKLELEGDNMNIRNSLEAFLEYGKTTSKNLSREIVLYSKPNCNTCQAVKKWLQSKKIKFEERDLNNIDVAIDLVMKNVVVLSAPILEISGRFYYEHEIKQQFEGR